MLSAQQVPLYVHTYKQTDWAILLNNQTALLNKWSILLYNQTGLLYNQPIPSYIQQDRSVIHNQAIPVYNLTNLPYLGFLKSFLCCMLSLRLFPVILFISNFFTTASCSSGVHFSSGGGGRDTVRGFLGTFGLSTCSSSMSSSTAICRGTGGRTGSVKVSFVGRCLCRMFCIVSFVRR